MRDKKRPPLASDLLNVLRLEIEKISDAGDRNIAECMVVVTSALEVGPDVDRLVEYTGYGRDFIEVISRRMRAARLWIDELVDDREWRDKDEELMADIFRHALVAGGSLLRECDENGGCTYLDAETRQWVGGWHPAPAMNVDAV